MIGFKVTPTTNFENGKLKNKNLTGVCIKTETIMSPKLKEDGTLGDTEIKIFCHVIWSGIAPYHPAVKLHEPQDLILLEEYTATDAITTVVADLMERVEQLEEDLYDEEDDLDQDFDENDDNGPTA